MALLSLDVKRGGNRNCNKTFSVNVRSPHLTWIRAISCISMTTLSNLKGRDIPEYEKTLKLKTP